MKNTHNLKGCRCPKNSDIRFCLGYEPTKILERILVGYKINTITLEEAIVAVLGLKL